MALDDSLGDQEGDFEDFSDFTLEDDLIETWKRLKMWSYNSPLLDYLFIDFDKNGNVIDLTFHDERFLQHYFPNEGFNDLDDVKEKYLAAMEIEIENSDRNSLYRAVRISNNKMRLLNPRHSSLELFSSKGEIKDIERFKQFLEIRKIEDLSKEDYYNPEDQEYTLLNYFIGWSDSAITDIIKRRAAVRSHH